MSEPSEHPEKTKSGWGNCGCWVLGMVLLVMLAGTALGPIAPSIKTAKESAAIQQLHAIGLAMYAYANDHKQAYPDGKSSTEVFQKLIDEGYVTDPSIFYVSYEGKVRAKAGQQLKPENVCFDVTAGVDSNSPSELPLIFLTGYKLTYKPGAAATALFRIFPDGIAVFYTNHSANFLKTRNADGSVPRFIPPEFKPDGKTYRQLTPDGTLP